MMKLTNCEQKLNPGKEFVAIFGEISNKYPQIKRILLINRTNWILPHILWNTPITIAATFYTDANKLGKGSANQKI